MSRTGEQGVAARARSHPAQRHWKCTFDPAGKMVTPGMIKPDEVLTIAIDGHTTPVCSI
jgi:hypothetical protein